uniref:Uncharacterized protein n=1 Tax=Oryza meridionalis TaxID=40149 RepID=A0A0E0E122_9ORYZ
MAYWHFICTDALSQQVMSGLKLIFEVECLPGITELFSDERRPMRSCLSSMKGTLWKCTGGVQRSATGEILLMIFDEIPAKDQDASLISVQISLKNISHLRFNGMTEIRIQGAKHQEN